MVPRSIGYSASSASRIAPGVTGPATSTLTSPPTRASVRRCAGSTIRTMAGSWQRLHLDRDHGRQVLDDGRPAVAGVGRTVNLAAGGAEVHAARLQRVHGHRV